MLKTDYKDDILNTDVNVNRKFNIVRSNGTVVEQNVELRETTTFKQTGDSFGAKDINETNKAIVGLQTEVDDVRGQIRTNLLNPTAPTQTINGVTFTNNGDGTYTVNGTASGQAPFPLMTFNDFAFLENKKLVGCPVGGSYLMYMLYVSCHRDSTWLKEYYEYGNGVIISNILSEAAAVTFFIVVQNGKTVNNLTFKPMLTTDLNATYDDFVPYTGDSGRLNEDVANLVDSVKGISAITNSDIDTILNS